MRKCLLLVLLLACRVLHAGGPEFFILMSDPQMGMFAKDANTFQEEANLRLAVDTVNRLKPMFVVVCGDLVNRTGDPAEVNAYQSIIRKINPTIPVYNVAGNHDVDNHPTPETLAIYRKNFGQDHYTFDAPGIRGIVLNSNLIVAPSKAPDEAKAQEKWLISELERAQQDKVENVFIFQHIPYFLRSPGEPDEYFNVPRAARLRYLNVFHKYGVKHVFAGHYHRNRVAHDGDLEIVTTGAVGMPIGNSRSGLRIVRLDTGRTESRFYDFGAIPNALDPLKSLPTIPLSAEEAGSTSQK